MTERVAIETARVFHCAGAELVGILHRPPRPRRLAVAIVVGGPQYRVGSHRLFVTLARALCAAGFAVLRFDVRGMGDSGGAHPGFEALGPDIAAALDQLDAAVPEADGVVLWGLCDAVPAMAHVAAQDPRVRGLVLLNPWAREDTGAETGSADDATLLRHHYRRRLGQRDFWATLLRGRTRWGDLPRLLGRLLRRLLRQRLRGIQDDTRASESLAARTIRSLGRFRGPVLLVMSGHDLTARGFDDAAARCPDWPALSADPRLTRLDLAEADHTFSDPTDTERVIAATRDWLEAIAAGETAGGDRISAAA